MSLFARRIAPDELALSSIEFPVGEGSTQVTLRLRRCEGASPKAPSVLLTHGGNTKSDIYLHPNGGLAGYLRREGFDVWMLDWRSSPFVTGPLLDKPPLGGSPWAECLAYTVDTAAAEDIPGAVRRIRAEIDPNVPLSIVAFCLSGGALSMAIARGHMQGYEISNVVLLTLGLFYEVPWNGWLKAEDFLLERILMSRVYRAVDPNHPNGWPDLLEQAYKRWPSAWLPHISSGEMLRRLSFMVGQPFSLQRLHPALRGNPWQLPTFFGALHMGLYLHTGQMVRRGYSALFNELDVIDRVRLCGRRAPAVGHQSDLEPRYFEELKRITLVSAAQNLLWHRDSMDLMHEWLLEHRCKSHKTVMPGYNIMELLWGEHAAKEVYPAIRDGL
jgi:pimeloyl-ACP methyl ester carboxylesterase